MKWTKCSTQAELDAAVARGEGAEVSCGEFCASGSASVWASGSASVWASGSASVWAYNSASVRAYGSASVRASGSASVMASGSASVWASGSASVWASGSASVWAYNSASVRASGSASVWAYNSASVWASGSASVRAGKSVAVHKQSEKAKIVGGVVINPYRPTTAKAWCKEYHVKVVAGVATVYKAVRENYQSSRGGDYTPGTVPVAHDWDGGKAECGGGMHFSPSPMMALDFDPQATRFMECRIALKDMRTPKAGDESPHKCKARGCCKPVRECDRNGKLIERGK